MREREMCASIRKPPSSLRLSQQRLDLYSPFAYVLGHSQNLLSPIRHPLALSRRRSLISRPVLFPFPPSRLNKIFAHLLSSIFCSPLHISHSADSSARSASAASRRLFLSFDGSGLRCGRVARPRSTSCANNSHSYTLKLQPSSPYSCVPSLLNGIWLCLASTRSHSRLLPFQLRSLSFPAPPTRHSTPPKRIIIIILRFRFRISPASAQASLIFPSRKCIVVRALAPHTRSAAHKNICLVLCAANVSLSPHSIFIGFFRFHCVTSFRALFAPLFLVLGVLSEAIKEFES